jgi:energy-coupling factor transport system ATP-binding protein
MMRGKQRPCHDTAVELRDVSFSYENGGEALRGINLRVKAGECVVLMGRSGCGKTTLTRIINGLAPEHYGGVLTGSLWINGEAAETLPLRRRAAIMGSVFQEPRSQFFSGELAGEVAFTAENLGFPAKEIRERTDRVIRGMGLDYIGHTPLDLLSAGETQKVAIASLRAASPGIFVFDEPSANLDEEASRQLALLMGELKSRGHTLVAAEHRLSYLMGIADRFIHLEGGAITAEYSPAQLLELRPDQRLALGLRRPENTPCPVLPAALPASDRTSAPVIETVNLSYRKNRRDILAGVSLSAGAGDLTAITGANGAGKTSLARIICGLLREDRGRVFIRGKALPPRKRRPLVWYGGNNMNTQFFSGTVKGELLLLHEKDEGRYQKALALLEQFGLGAYLHRHPAVLSGGQKQRLSIILGLVSRREVLVFDEPSSGLDGENLRRAAAALRSAAESGAAVFVITHDTELIGACCTRRFNLEQPA